MKTTSPPRPPSPPSGPPFGTFASRRKLSAPSPPRPASTWRRARSENGDSRTLRTSVGIRADGDVPPVAARPELDLTVARGEDRVVAADTRTRAGAEPAAALADEDHARLDLFAGEDLDAEALGLGVPPVAGRSETFLVRHLLPLLLRLERRLERVDRAFPVGVLVLVRKRRLQHRALPARRGPGDLGHGQVGVPLRELLRRLGCGFLLLDGGGCPLRGCLPAADLLDLDLRQARTETRVTPVPRLRAVLPDPDLVAENVPDDTSRDGYSLRREIGLAVAAQEENAGMERLPLRRLDPVHEDPFALLDAV